MKQNAIHNKTKVFSTDLVSEKTEKLNINENRESKRSSAECIYLLFNSDVKNYIAE